MMPGNAGRVGISGSESSSENRPFHPSDAGRCTHKGGPHGQLVEVPVNPVSPRLQGDITLFDPLGMSSRLD